MLSAELVPKETFIFSTSLHIVDKVNMTVGKRMLFESDSTGIRMVHKKMVLEQAFVQFKQSNSTV